MALKRRGCSTTSLTEREGGDKINYKGETRMARKMKILEYNVVFTPEKDGGFSAIVPDLPGCGSQGDTFEETEKNVKEAIGLYLETEKSEIYQTTPDEARSQFMATVKVNA